MLVGSVQNGAHFIQLLPLIKMSIFDNFSGILQYL